MDLIITTETVADEPITRSVSLTNDEWLVLSQCAEAFAETYRKQHSQVIATYVTRGDLSNAELEAQKMNVLLQKLDKLQVALMS